jgi:4-alpha-glucanotransferase
LEELQYCRARDLGDFKSGPYDILQSAGGMGRLMLSRTGTIRSAEGGAVEAEVTVRKSFHLEERLLGVEYDILALSSLPDILFSSELSLTLPSGPHPDGRYRLFTKTGTVEDGVTSSGVSLDVSRVELFDSGSGMTIALLPSPHAAVVRFPLESVSQSESGIERTYQGSTVTLLWPCHLNAGQSFHPAIKLQVN